MPLHQSQFLEMLTSTGGGGGATRPAEEVGKLDVTDEVFPLPINASGATFSGPVTFTRCRFLDEVKLQGARFQQGAQFTDCVFAGPADFSWAVFSGLCSFWKCGFEGTADYSNSVVQPLEAARSGSVQSPYLRNGESNFSWTMFEHPVTFDRMQFGGPAWFWRTVWHGGVRFDEGKFDDAVTFYGAEHDVCLSLADVSPGLFQNLRMSGVLAPAAEGPGYGHFASSASATELDERLRHGFTEAQRREVMAIWQKRAVPTIAEGATASMRSVTFGKPAGVEFTRMDLSRFLFSGTALAEVGFSGVRWTRRPVFPMAARVAAYDEEVLPAGPQPVARLYSQLEANSGRNGRYREASDFRYGRMEMLRRGGPALIRHLSLLAAYKHLSGYGERYGLALSWLAFFVIVLFPAIYLVLGLEGGVGRALLHSFEASTFLEPSGTSTAEVPTRFAEGVERLLVPVQAGLCALAVNRRLGRA